MRRLPKVLDDEGIPDQVLTMWYALLGTDELVAREEISPRDAQIFRRFFRHLLRNRAEYLSALAESQPRERLKLPCPAHKSGSHRFIKVRRGWFECRCGIVETDPRYDPNDAQEVPFPDKSASDREWERHVMKVMSLRPRGRKKKTKKKRRKGRS